MKKSKLLLVEVVIVIFLSVLSLSAQPDRETRAVWVVTNFRLDWPPPTFDVSEQKEALDEIFNIIREKNFNTVYFQSIIKGTSLFKSKLLPFCPYFIGTPADSDFFDPLQYAIDLARKYGLEIHAWVNTVRVFSGDENYFLEDSNHIVNSRPNLVERIVRKGETSYWLNFGNPEARRFMVDVLSELARRYDVDGIQLDFLRYPGHSFPDVPEFIAFGDTLNRDDWRRENINKFVQALHDSIRAIKPLLKIGATPFGIYKNRKNAEGNEAYYTVYQDSRKWIRNGWVDYLAPQIYWDIENNPRFDTLAVDWKNNSFGRNIVLGVASYKPEVYRELDKIISFSRMIGVSGTAMFRYDFIKNRMFPEYKKFVFPAEMPWLDSHHPLPPFNFIVKTDSGIDNKIEMSWHKSLSENIKYYALYQVDSDDLSGNKTLVTLLPADANFVKFGIERPKAVIYQFEMCSVNKLWNESNPSKNKPKVVLKKLMNLISLNNIISAKPILIKGNDSNKLCYYSIQKGELKIKLIGVSTNKTLIVNIIKGINYITLPNIGNNINSVELYDSKTNILKYKIDNY
jgi:uncharacterized lipoprotein YddW (UPF0748 family)